MIKGSKEERKNHVKGKEKISWSLSLCLGLRIKIKFLAVLAFR
jgi:hypothetical protein